MTAEQTDTFVVQKDFEYGASGYRRGTMTPMRRKENGLKNTEEILIGPSVLMHELRERIRKLARRNNHVLITGPTGSGKELVAQALHYESKRCGRFIPVNVGAIPDSLFEAELFGYVRGAFSGAVRDRMGLMRSASGGTIFLDEIGELSPSLQVKLLRVLESREIWPVGADRGCQVDLRVVAATNANLRDLVDRGVFRIDLWHRLCNFSIQVPKLCDRLDDIPHLVNYFLGQIAQEYQEVPRVFTDGAFQLLLQHTWPGNVRELREIVGLLVAETESIRITETEVSRVLKSTAEIERSHPKNLPGSEEESLYGLWIKHDRNADRVAKELGISRSSVYRRIQRLGMTEDVGVRSWIRRR